MRVIMLLPVVLGLSLFVPAAREGRTASVTGLRLRDSVTARGTTRAALYFHNLPSARVQGEAVNQQPMAAARERRGRAFYGFSDLTKWERKTPVGANAPAGLTSLTSPLFPVDVPANEIIVSWNADAPAGTGIVVEARAVCGEQTTKFYTLGLWSKDGGTYPRASVNGQRDADGDVRTDTLALNKPATALQIRVTLQGKADETPPTLKFVGVSAADTRAAQLPLEANRAVWGKEIVVPPKTQLGYPGGSGWCSPTSTSMTLAFWARSLHRPELDVPVPDTAHAIFDKVYNGTGNWPFNTAYAGAFPGIRAYVTRLSDIRELEDWVAIGIPPVVSVSYDLLKGKAQDNDPGHLMVCDGFTKDGDIVLNDPAHHPEKGEACRRVFPRANFLRGWGRSKFLVYLIYPEGAKLPADTYGHWNAQ